MKIFGSRFVMVAGLASVAGLLFNVNCGSDNNGGGTGGAAGHGTGGTGTGGVHTGGTTGTGGTGTGGTGTGGVGGKGGAAGSSVGGSAGGAAGSSANGGAGGTAGAAGGAGGTAGGAGASATGGAAGGGAGTSGAFDGGTPAGTALFTFDTDAQGFGLNPYTGQSNSLDGTTTDGSAKATVAWTGSQGDPSVGALVSDATFSAYNQFVEVGKSFPSTALYSLAGKTKLHVRVKIASGLDAYPGVQPVVTSETNADAASPTYTECYHFNSALAGNGWHDYTLDLTTCPSGFDATKIELIAVDITAGAAPSQDSGTPPAPTPAVIYVDTFSAE